MVIGLADTFLPVRGPFLPDVPGCTRITWSTCIHSSVGIKGEAYFNIGSGHWGSSRIVIIFTSVHSVRWEGEAQGSLLFVGHCDFEKGSQNQHSQSTLLVGREGGGHNKEYSV